MNNNLTKLLHNMFSKQNNNSQNQSIIETYAKNHELSEDAKKALWESITAFEEKGFQLQDLENALVVSNKNVQFEINSNPFTAEEVFCAEKYNIPLSLIDTRKNYCVVDIGANRGYSALYFAAQKWVRRIDAFEIMPQTFKFALKNFALNTTIKKKINIYNYGLGNDTEEIKAFIVPYRDDLSTVSQDWLQSCCPHLAADAQPISVQLVQASFCLKDLMEHREISNIILKIDANGAEHEILQDLADNFPKIFEEIKIITGKTYSELDTILKILTPFNFKLVSAQPKERGCSFLLSKQNNND